MEWISVKDNLPEDKKYVLLYGSKYCDEVCLGRLIDGKWFEIEFGEIRTQENITHWMPLPTPPLN